MRRILIFILFLIINCMSVYAANLTMLDKPDDSAPTKDDAMYTINSPLSGPSDKHVLLGNLQTLMLELDDLDAIGLTGTSNALIEFIENESLADTVAVLNANLAIGTDDPGITHKFHVEGSSKLKGDIALENNEEITNNADGRVCINGSGGTIAENLCVYTNFANNEIELGSTTGATILNLSSSFSLRLTNNDKLLFGGSDYAYFKWATSDTKDTLKLLLRNNGNAASGVLIVAPYTGESVDYAVTNHTDPTIQIQSGDITNVNKYIQFYHNQTDGIIEAGSGNIKLNGNSVVNGLLTTTTLKTTSNLSCTYLNSDSAGAVGCVTGAIPGGGSTPGGSTTQVQFNDVGSFNGDAGMTYSKSTDTLTLGTDVIANGHSLCQSDGTHCPALSSQWTTAGSEIYYTDNVGIKTINPTSELDVTGTIKASVDVVVGGQSVCLEDGTNCSGNVGIQTTTVTCSDAASCLDDNSLATATLTITDGNVRLTCNDPDGSTVTLSESGVSNGDNVIITNLGLGDCNFADTYAVSELNGNFVMGKYDTLTIQYVVDRWVETARSAN